MTFPLCKRPINLCPEEHKDLVPEIASTAPAPKMAISALPLTPGAPFKILQTCHHSKTCAIFVSAKKQQLPLFDNT